MKIIRLLGKGSAHEDKGMNCQDRLSVVTVLNGTKVFCISDGCSGSKYAEIAAQSNLDVINRIFAQCTIKELTFTKLKELFPYLEKSPTPIEENDFVSCLKLIFRIELYKTAKSLLNINPETSELFATLLFVVREEEKTLVGHIGDGNVVLYDKDGGIVFRSEEENGSDSSHTIFTLSESFLRHFRCDVIPTSSYDSMVMFSDGPQTMFKLEGGTIPKGAYEMAVTPVKNGDINSDAELLEHMREYIGHAMHYIFDDWSIIIACDPDSKEDNQLEKLTPAPLKQIFMKEFNRKRGIEEPAPQTNEDETPGGSEESGEDKSENLPSNAADKTANIPSAPNTERDSAPSSSKPLADKSDFDINEKIVNGRPDKKDTHSFRFCQQVVSADGRKGVIEERVSKKNERIIRKKNHWFF